jgi:hypothetical protein
MLQPIYEWTQIGKVKRDHRNQDEHTAEQGVQEKLDSGIFPAWSAPQTDQEIHRQQHHFPKDVEQEKVEGQKRSHHASFQDQEQNQVPPNGVFDVPAGSNGQHANQRRQHHQRYTDAISTEEVINIEAANPGPASHEVGVVVSPTSFVDPSLVGACCQRMSVLAGVPIAVEQLIPVHEQKHAQQQRQHGACQGHYPHQVLLAARNQQ